MQGLFDYLSGAKNSVTRERWHSAQSDLLQAKELARRKGYTTVVAYIGKALMWIEGKGQPNESLAFFNIQKAQDWLIDNGKVKKGGFDAEAIRGDEALRAAIKAEVRHQMESRRSRRKRARRITEYRTIRVTSGGVDGALKLSNELAKNGAYNNVAGTTIQAKGSFTYGQVETAIRSLMESGTVLEVALESVQEQSGNQPSILLKDGQEKFRGTYNECLAKLHQLQPNSWDHALKYEGWKIVPQGKESVRFSEAKTPRWKQGQELGIAYRVPPFLSDDRVKVTQISPQKGLHGAVSFRYHVQSVDGKRQGWLDEDDMKE